MKRNRRNNLIITFSILIVLVIGITIVYAALSASLKISTSNVTQNVASWNVGFTPETLEPKIEGNSSSCGKATVINNSVTIGEVILTKPGDKCIWNPTIKNSGTINAKLTSLNFSSSNEISCRMINDGEYLCGDIRYYIWVNGRSHFMAVGELLDAGDSNRLEISAQYNANSVSASKIVHTGVTFNLEWSQN